MDDLWDTCDTLDVGAGEQLHDGRVHPYFARRSSHCAGGRPLSETITLFTRWGKEGKAGAKGVRTRKIFSGYGEVVKTKKFMKEV